MQIFATGAKPLHVVALQNTVETDKSGLEELKCKFKERDKRGIKV